MNNPDPETPPPAEPNARSVAARNKITAVKQREAVLTELARINEEISVYEVGRDELDTRAKQTRRCLELMGVELDDDLATQVEPPTPGE